METYTSFINHYNNHEVIREVIGRKIEQRILQEGGGEGGEGGRRGGGVGENKFITKGRKQNSTGMNVSINDMIGCHKTDKIASLRCKTLSLLQLESERIQIF